MGYAVVLAALAIFSWVVVRKGPKLVKAYLMSSPRPTGKGPW